MPHLVQGAHTIRGKLQAARDRLGAIEEKAHAAPTIIRACVFENQNLDQNQLIKKQKRRRQVIVLSVFYIALLFQLQSFCRFVCLTILLDFEINRLMKITFIISNRLPKHSIRNHISFCIFVSDYLLSLKFVSNNMFCEFTQ